MAEEYNNNTNTNTNTNISSGHDDVESKDRGMFDFLGKKDHQETKPALNSTDHHREEAISSQFEEKVHVSEPVKEEGEEKKEGGGSLLSKLHRSGSSSSSSSEEEVEEEGRKVRRKKEKKNKKKEDTSVPVEKCDDSGVVAPEEKKGFMEKIKEKLPGKKPAADVHEGEVHHVTAVAPTLHEAPPAAAPAGEYTPSPHQLEEKKGFLEKIKEKLPGYHAKGTEADHEKEDKKESH